MVFHPISNSLAQTLRPDDWHLNLDEGTQTLTGQMVVWSREPQTDLAIVYKIFMKLAKYNFSLFFFVWFCPIQNYGSMGVFEMMTTPNS